MGSRRVHRCISFPLPVAEDVAFDRVRAYLWDRGYKPRSRDARWEWHRGSDHWMALIRTPVFWGCKVTISTQHTDGGLEMMADFDINLRHQTVADADRNFWQEELDGLVAAVRDNQRPVPSMLDGGWQVVRDIAIALGVGVVVYAMAGLVPGPADGAMRQGTGIALGLVGVLATSQAARYSRS